MQRFILGRVVQSIVSMFVVTVVVFALVRLSGDPIQIMMPAEATKADIDLVVERYGATLELDGVAVLIVLVVALPVGVYSAVRRRGSALDYAARAFAALGQAVPPFWLGLGDWVRDRLDPQLRQV